MLSLSKVFIGAMAAVTGVLAIELNGWDMMLMCNDGTRYYKEGVLPQGCVTLHTFRKPTCEEILGMDLRNLGDSYPVKWRFYKDADCKVEEGEYIPGYYGGYYPEEQDKSKPHGHDKTKRDAHDSASDGHDSTWDDSRDRRVPGSYKVEFGV